MTTGFIIKCDIPQCMRKWWKAGNGRRENVKFNSNYSEGGGGGNLGGQIQKRLKKKLRQKNFSLDQEF